MKDFKALSDLLNKYPGFPKSSTVSTDKGSGIKFGSFTLDDIENLFNQIIETVEGAVQGNKAPEYSITYYLPSEFTNTLKSLKVKGLTLVEVDNDGFQLDFEVVWTQPWNIKNTVTINNPSVGFSISKPPAPGKLSVSALLSSGNITFNKAELNLQLTAKIPSFILTAELSSAAKANGGSHQQLATQYLGDLKKPKAARITVEDIKFTAAPYVSNYSLHLAVDNVLDIHDKLRVKKFQADINYRGGVTGGYSILAYTDIEIGFDKKPLDITLSAEYKKEKAGSTNGGASSWKFSGNVGHPISVADALADIENLFGAQNPYNVPAFLNKIVIEKLGFTFNGATSSTSTEKEYTFTLEVKFPVNEKELDLSIYVKYGEKDTRKSLELSGALTIGGRAFTIDFKKTSDTKQPAASMTILEALYNSKSDKIDLTRLLAGAVGDSSLEDTLPDVQISLEEVLFALINEGGAANKYLFGVTLGLELDMSKLPLVGSLFKPSQGVKDIRILYATQHLMLNEVQALNSGGKINLPESTGRGTNGSAPSAMAPADPKTTVILSKGLSVIANADFTGSSPKGLALPFGKKQSTGGKAVASSPYKPQTPASVTGQPANLPSAQRITWLDIGATLGPFTLQRIGAAYKKGALELLMTSSFRLGILNFSLDGLGVKVNPFPPKSSDPGDILKSISPELLGMEADLQKGPLSISGGFLRDDKNYYGEVSVMAGPLSFMAIGGYSDTDPASFFIYVSLDAPLGGPPFFIVTGLAGGFGVNRRLELPTIDTVTTYPLLPHNAPPQGNSPSSTLNSVIPQLARIFQPKPGEYWIAAGVQFTSFEMIDAFVLVSVSFGVDFQLGLLGQATMNFPKYDPVPLAFVQLDLVASLTPATGLLSVEGRLAPNCYVLNPLVKISGGFAFLVWFNGPHKGDFVVSLGGYHPAFKKPSNYPSVPRLQITYGIGPFAITGQLYFALTPSMMMAGMAVSATWSSGPVSLWFDAGVDFLLGWAPFHYLGDAYLRIGANVDLALFSITVHVGAEIQMWGPQFGGKAEVDLDVVSVTIHFGADKNPPPPVGWQKFKTKFLPKGADKKGLEVVKGAVSKGMLAEKKGDFDWILDPDHFMIRASSVIPANQAKLNSSSLEESVAHTEITEADVSAETKQWETRLHIGPMDQQNIQSLFHMTLEEWNESNVKYEAFGDLKLDPIIGASPQALWGPFRDASDKNPNNPEGQLIQNTLQGFHISPILRTPDKLNNILLEELLFQQDHQTSFMYSASSVDTKDAFSSNISADGDTLTIGSLPPSKNYVLSVLGNPQISEKRDQLIGALQAAGFETLQAVAKTDGKELKVLSTETALTDWPMVKALGA